VGICRGWGGWRVIVKGFCENVVLRSIGVGAFLGGLRFWGISRCLAATQSVSW